MYIMEYLDTEDMLWKAMSGTNSEDKGECEVLAYEQIKNWKKFGLETETRFTDINY